MNNHNNFPEGARELFNCYKCWICSKNRADSLHHILGRGNNKDKTESSILNCAPICNYNCHLKHHGKISTEQEIKKLLSKTYEYLKSANYELTELDAEFLEKYIEYYI